MTKYLMPLSFILILKIYSNLIYPQEKFLNGKRRLKQKWTFHPML